VFWFVTAGDFEHDGSDDDDDSDDAEEFSDESDREETDVEGKNIRCGARYVLKYCA